MIKNRLISLQEAANILHVPYIQILTDPRLRKVKVNKYYTKDQTTNKLTMTDMKVESPGRFPMVYTADLTVYRYELLESKDKEKEKEKTKEKEKEKTK
jgi:hypothetical protein